MLTKREMELVEQYARIVSTSFSFPFDWKNGRLSPTKSKVKRVLVTANFLFSCAYLVFILFRLWERFGGGYTLDSFPFHACAILAHVVCVTFHLHMFIYTTEMSMLFNQLKAFNMGEGKVYMGRCYHISNVRDNVIRFLHRWINVVACIYAALFLAMPGNTHYIYSAVPVESRTASIQFLFFVLEAFQAYKVMMFHLFVVLFGFFYIVSTTFWVKKVCMELPVTLAKEGFGKAEENIRLYRPLALLNVLYNTSFASLVIPVFKSLVEICFVVSTYGSIRLYGRVSLIVFSLLPGVASLLFVEHQFAVDQMAWIHENSSRIQENYKRNYMTAIATKLDTNTGQLHIRYMNCFLKSCRPLRCQLTHALFVEKGTRLVLLNMLLNMLVTMLLGDKEGQ